MEVFKYGYLRYLCPRSAVAERVRAERELPTPVICVVRSMTLYANSLTAQGKVMLRRPQRVLTIKISRAYRTTYCDAAWIMAGNSSLGPRRGGVLCRLLADGGAKGGMGEATSGPINRWRTNFPRVVFWKWYKRLEEQKPGHWTIGAILGKRANRSWERLNPPCASLDGARLLRQIPVPCRGQDRRPHVISVAAAKTRCSTYCRYVRRLMHSGP